MKNEIKCPKCGQTKSKFHREEQRYKCKSCGCNHPGEQRDYSIILNHEQ